MLGVDFPTQKAYGITARETIKVLVNMNYLVKVVCRKSNYTDEDFKSILNCIENFPNNSIANFLTNIGKSSSSKINIFFWNLSLVLSVIQSFKIISRFDPELIWVRDPLVALIIARRFKKFKIALEVHQSSSSFVYKRLMKLSKNIRFFPINNENKYALLRIAKSEHIFMAPMAINKSNLATKEDCINFVNNLRLNNSEIKIGYIGQFFPGGYSKGIEDLIFLANLYHKHKMKYLVKLVGANQDSKNFFEKFINQYQLNSTNLEICEYVQHSFALKKMKELDVLVLPEYKNKNYNGMPIKLLEYLSSGRIVLVADIPLYRNIFDGTFQPFYYLPGRPDSLLQSIRIAIESKNLADILMNGINFASQFTWEKRTSSILHHCSPKI